MCCKKRKIGHELRTLDNMMSRNLMAAARERGVDELTAMHGWILGYLCRNEHKDIFQKDIEAEFKICRSTVTNILKLMEKKGYIKRESVPYDARLKKLVLTDTGRELHEKTKDMIDMLEEQTVAGISKEDLDTAQSAASGIWHLEIRKYTNSSQRRSGMARVCRYHRLPDPHLVYRPHLLRPLRNEDACAWK